MSKNSNLINAQIYRQDEFYITYQEVQDELQHYSKHFKGKTILCNCDDPRISNFAKYFIENFNQLGLKRLICTGYNKQAIMPQMSVWELLENNPERGYLLDITRVPVTSQDFKQLKYNGDFRTKECEQFLDVCDIVVTGPPFSLFREYMRLLIKHKKQFLIVGSVNAITYREFFPLLKDNKVWLGYGFQEDNAYFFVPDHQRIDYAQGVYNSDTGLVKFRNCVWFTTLDHSKRHETLKLTKHFDIEEYPSYDNYDAIEVSRVADIPKDYDGVMGVPITFLKVYNPDQFRIIGLDRYTVPRQMLVGGRVALDGQACYARVLIQQR